MILYYIQVLLSTQFYTNKGNIFNDILYLCAKKKIIRYEKIKDIIHFNVYFNSRH